MKKFWQKLKDVKENGVTIATTALSSSSSSSSSSAAAAGAAAATTTASVGDKTTDPTKLDQAVEKFLQQQLERQMANKFHKKGTVLKINNTLTPTQTHAFNMYQHQQSRL